MNQENCGACKWHWRGNTPSAPTSPGSKADPEGERTSGPDDAPALKPREINQLLNLMGKCAAKTDEPSSIVIRSAMQEIQKNQPPETLDTLLQKERTHSIFQRACHAQPACCRIDCSSLQQNLLSLL